MRVLLDTNIAIDFLRKREPFHESARLLMALGYLGEFELWISPSQLGDLFYVLTKGGKPALAPAVAEELRRLEKFVHVCTLGEAEAVAALELGWDDLEDALVYQAARSLRADAIVTRNQADFAQSSIPVFDCDEFFAWCAKETGIEYAVIGLQ